MTGIYKITSPSGRIYIGQSWDLLNRQCSYRKLHCKQQPKIYESIKKYGWDQHRFEIIHELPLDVTQEVLTQYETVYWDAYRSCGFDMMNVKEPGAYGKHSDETKRKMQIVQLKTDEVKRKISQANKGKTKGVPKSEEHRKRIAEALRGKKKSEEHNKRNSEAQRGKKLSEETIRKRQETRKLRGHTIPESFKNNWKKNC